MDVVEVLDICNPKMYSSLDLCLLTCDVKFVVQKQ